MRRISALILAISVTLFAAGLHLPGIGSYGISTGGAFRAAAGAPSSIFWNPAGITQLHKPEIEFFCQWVYNDFRMLPNDTMTDIAHVLRTDESRMTSPNFILPHAFFALPLYENKLFAGIGLYTTFGVASTWDVMKDSDLDYVTEVNARRLSAFLRDTLLQFTVTETLPQNDFKGEIYAYCIAPTVAYEIGDKFSIGASLLLGYSSFDVTLPTTDSVKMAADTGLVFERANMTGTGFGTNIGFLFKPTDKLSIATSLRYETTYKYEGDFSARVYKFYNEYLNRVLGGSRFAGGYVDKPNIDAKGDLKRPLITGLGISYDLTDKLTISSDLQYTGWSVLDTVFLLAQASDDTLMRLPLAWSDSWRISGGVEYGFARYVIRGGAFFEPHPAVPEYQNLFIPDFEDMLVFTCGFGAQWEHLGFDFSGEIEYFPEKSVDPNFSSDNRLLNIPGEYHGFATDLGISVRYRF